MNKEQADLLSAIEAEKRRAHPDQKLLKQLVRELTSYDDRAWDLTHSRQCDPGGRSRSPSFGRWKSDDDVSLWHGRRRR